jgi:acetyltransferase
MSIYRLDRLLAPRSIALVGASLRENSVGRKILWNLREVGFGGSIQLVNSKHREIEGVPAVRSVAELSPVPDLLIIAVPPAATRMSFRPPLPEVAPLRS